MKNSAFLSSGARRGGTNNRIHRDLIGPRTRRGRFISETASLGGTITHLSSTLNRSGNRRGMYQHTEKQRETARKLLTGNTQCRKDLIGKRFGKLNVIKFHGIRRSPRLNRPYVYWLCRCDCGGETFVETSNLTCGAVVSCGCIASRRSIGKRYPGGFTPVVAKERKLQYEKLRVAARNIRRLRSSLMEPASTKA